MLFNEIKTNIINLDIFISNKKFIDLLKINMINFNEKLDTLFFDFFHFISTNILFNKFNCNRLLIRYGEEEYQY